MIYNVIPINYLNGAGGEFLSSLLYEARRNKSTNWSFSEYGNSNGSDKDWSPHTTLPSINFIEDSTCITSTNILVEHAKTIPEDTVAYIYGHYADPDLLMKYFDKQIKIYFLPEQLYEIIGIFMLKQNKILPSVDLTDPIEQEKYKNHYFNNWSKVAPTTLGRLFNNCPDLEPRMLNISWNEMMYYDPEILISKLHQFTQIPKENFNRNNLNEWRRLTHKPLDKLKQAGLI